MTLFFVVAGCDEEGSAAAETAPALTFITEGHERVLSLPTLEAEVATTTVSIHDPNYKKDKRYRGLPLGAVLSHGFGKDANALRGKRFVFRATDGYAVHAASDVVFEEGAVLVFDDLDVDGFEPIGSHQASPAPFYIVWRGKKQQDQQKYPWPYALVSIEIVDLKTSYGHTYPDHVNDPLAKKGHAIFLRECIRCHAINRQGGSLGPDLNVPKNITDYRDETFLRAYIRSPKSYRYGNMPEMPHLGDAELDAILRYLEVMKSKQRDDG